MTSVYTTTFGRQVQHHYLPLYADVENDDMEVYLTDSANYYLNLYTVPYGASATTVDGYTT